MIQRPSSVLDSWAWMKTTFNHPWGGRKMSNSKGVESVLAVQQRLARYPPIDEEILCVPAKARHMAVCQHFIRLVRQQARVLYPHFGRLE